MADYILGPLSDLRTNLRSTKYEREKRRSGVLAVGRFGRNDRMLVSYSHPNIDIPPTKEAVGAYPPHFKDSAGPSNS